MVEFTYYNRLINIMNYKSHPTAIIDEELKLELTQVYGTGLIFVKVEIGKEVKIGQNVFVADNVVIGDKKIQIMFLYDGVTLESEVFCDQVWFSQMYTIKISYKQNMNLKNFDKKGVSLGANCTVICGLTLEILYSSRSGGNKKCEALCIDCRSTWKANWMDKPVW